MNHDRKQYLERFMAASRVALGLAPEPGETAQPGIVPQTAIAESSARVEAPCPLGRLQLSEPQREQVMAVLHEHIPAIRARMRAERRARNRRQARGFAGMLAAVVDAAEATAEIERLRAYAMRDLRRVLTPYQRVQFDVRSGRERRGS